MNDSVLAHKDNHLFRVLKKSVFLTNRLIELNDSLIKTVACPKLQTVYIWFEKYFVAVKTVCTI